MDGSAGLHASCLPWLKKRDVAVVGSDLATNVMPSQVKGIVLPVHLVLIIGMGVPILDNVDLEATAGGRPQSDADVRQSRPPAAGDQIHLAHVDDVQKEPLKNTYEV